MTINRYKLLGLDRSADAPFPNVKIRNRASDLYVEFQQGNRLENIAMSVYGKPHYWWVIMLANPEYAFEYEIPFGEVIRVPLPLNSVLDDISNG